MDKTLIILALETLLEQVVDSRITSTDEETNYKIKRLENQIKLIRKL
jgi:hypothetical protein